MNSSSTGRRARLLTEQADALEAAAEAQARAARAARELADLETASAGDGWVDQASSPLGKRAHLALVRTGKLPGRKVGKRVLVRREDLERFIEGHPSPKARPAPAPPASGASIADELRAELGLAPRGSRRAS